MNAPLTRNDWQAAGVAQLDDTIALRRAIHAEPEIGLHCPKTTSKLKAALAGLPLEIHDSTSTTGFIAILRGGRSGAGDNTRTVLLRGDMDALPLSEDTGLPFAPPPSRARCTPAATTPIPPCSPAPRAPCARARKSCPERWSSCSSPARRATMAPAG